MSERLLRAAQARAAAGRELRDRPSERRSVEGAAPMTFAHVRAAAHITLRAPDAEAGTGMDFHGVASVVESPYEMWDWAGAYTEVVDAGAFDDSLARADLDVPLVLAHDQLRRIARTTTGSLLLSMSDEGLVVDAPNLDPDDADVAYIAPKLRAGLVDEMSFAFRIDAGIWSPDWTQFRVTKADIHRGDVAIVGYGANPATYGGLRAAQIPLMPSRLLPWLDAAIA